MTNYKSMYFWYFAIIGILIHDGHKIELKRETNCIHIRRTDELDEADIYNNEIEQFVSNFNDNVISIWDYAFSEMMNNAIEHSKANQILIGVLQDYMSTTIIIRDNGIGIFKNIMDFYKLDTLDDAVTELFKGKLTTANEHHSGEGIFFTSRLMDKFYAMSDGKIFSHNKYFDISGDVEAISKDINFDKGTVIYMELSNFSNKATKEIFDVFSDDDGDFIRTSIPLKHIFERDPVARSQARKLCFRFENFTEVILDFDGISWIGQGFADEIFRVYQKKNPNLKFIVKNSNKDIDKMIHHVKCS